MQLQKYNTQATAFLNNVRTLLHRWGFKCGFVQTDRNIWCLNIPVNDGSGTQITIVYSMTWNEFRLEYLNYGGNCQLVSICMQGELDEQIDALCSEQSLYEAPLMLMLMQQTLG